MRCIHHRPARAILALGAFGLVAGCGDTLSGTYGDKGGVSFEFHRNGKVELDVIGPVQEASYVVEDGKVKITHGNQGTMVLKIDERGCLDGGFMLGRLCKQ